MRFSYSCPKCSSKKVVKVIGSPYNQYQKIPLHKWSIKHAVLDRYICTECGYTEEYVQLSTAFKRWGQKELEKPNQRPDDYV